MIGRRDVIAAGLAIVSGAAVGTTAKAIPAAAAPPAANPTPAERLAQAIAGTRMPVEFDGARFAGAGYDWLLRNGRESQAFLLGEEHGIAENPLLAAQLFTALAPTGYRHAIVEISPPMSDVIEQVERTEGPAALRKALVDPGTRVPFFGLKQEADWLEAIFAAVPSSKRALWGIDYEVMADRHLIRALESRAKPAPAAAALSKLKAASDASWSRYDSTRNPQYIFSFAGDPRLVRDVRTAWPNADARSLRILDTLETTLEINALFVSGKTYESNVVRSRLMRSNLLGWWRTKSPADRAFAKLGASHAMRGLNMADVFDVGTLIPELVAEAGGKSFHVMVLPGPGAQTANFDPSAFRYVPGSRNEYGRGMDLFDQAVLPNAFTLFDTAPLRPVVSASNDEFPAPLRQVVHGFDAVLVMTGSHPSTNL